MAEQEAGSGSSSTTSDGSAASLNKETSSSEKQSAELEVLTTRIDGTQYWFIRVDRERLRFSNRRDLVETQRPAHVGLVPSTKLYEELRKWLRGEPYHLEAEYSYTHEKAWDW